MKTLIIGIFASLVISTPVRAVTFVPLSLQPTRSIGAVKTNNNILELSTGTGARSRLELSRWTGTSLNILIAEGSATQFLLKEKGIYYFEYQLETEEKGGNDELSLFNGKKWINLANTSTATLPASPGFTRSNWVEARVNNKSNNFIFLANDTRNIRGMTYVKIRNLRRKIPEKSNNALTLVIFMAFASVRVKLRVLHR
jgi:hypothetical protein